MNKPGGKHLNLNDRQTILRMIEDHASLKEIAQAVDKDPRAVSREVRNRRELSYVGKKYNVTNPKYEVPCKRCSKFPFVCNGCTDKRYCMYIMRFHYQPEAAHKMYRITLREARLGLNLTEGEYKKLDQTIYYGVQNGQSLHHIFVNNEDLPVSLRTAYRYIDYQLLSAKNIDLRRKVRLRKRVTPKKPRILLDSRVRQNRLYSDYIRFTVTHPGVPVTQIDCIESCKGIATALLTIHFTSVRFMLAFLLPNQDSENVTKVFRYLQDVLTAEEYKKLFAIILTDRGMEFSDPESIEVDYKTGEMLANVFYCDPLASNQKAQIEENHTLIRYVLPKSTNLSYLTPDNVTLLLSHVNSYHRKVIGSSPIELFKLYYGMEILEKLKVREIAPDSVYLKPDLFTR